MIVADASTSSHLSTLAQIIVADHGLIPCGSAGLAAAMAEIMKDKTRRVVTAPLKWGGPFLAVVGSKSQMSRRQVNRVKQLAWVSMVEASPSALTEQQREREIDRVVQQVLEMFRHSKAVLLYLQEDATESNLDPRMIASGLGEITLRILQGCHLQGLLLTGGDITASVCNRLDGGAFEILSELEPGITLGKFTAAKTFELAVITKAGSFGDEVTLVRLLESIV